MLSLKSRKSNTFYNELINANADFVNKAKEQYGIDLHNFKNLQDAKEAMVTETASKIQGPTEMNTGEFKPIDVEDLLKTEVLTRIHGNIKRLKV